jgi:hypothetical protein
MRARRLCLVALATCSLLGFAAGNVEAASFTLGRSASPLGPQAPVAPLVGAGEGSGELTASPGVNFTVVVDLDGPDELFGYTIDILIEDADEVQLVDAVQLACLPGASTCDSVDFSTVDAVSTSQLRLSVLSFDPLSIAGGGSVPAGLLSLTFEVLAPSSDGEADVVIGLLDASADAVTSEDLRGVPVNLAMTPDRLSLDVVPEPASAVLLGLGLLCLALPRAPSKRGVRGRGQTSACLLGLGLLLLSDPALAAMPTCNLDTGMPSTCDEPAEEASNRCQCRQQLLLGAGPANLVAADEFCTAALGEALGEEEEEEVRLLRAWTRILRVLGGNEPGPLSTTVTGSFVEMMDAFMIDEDGRNLYAWDAGLPRDESDPARPVDLPDDAPTGSQFQTALVGLLALPLGSSVLDASIEDLRAIQERTTDDDVVVLCEPEYATIEKAVGTDFDWLDDDLKLEIDWGDVQIMEMGLLHWKAQLLQYYSQDSELDLQSYTPWTSAPRIQADIVERPGNENLLTLVPGREAALAEAAQANREATQAYFDGSRFIRADGIQEGQLFRIDVIGGNPDNELEVREHVAAFGTVLDRPAIVLEPTPGDFIDEAAVIESLNREFDHELDPMGGIVADLGLFYDSQPFSLRGVIPVFAEDNGVDSGRLIAGGSYPDRAFRGALVPPKSEADKQPFLDCFDQPVMDPPGGGPAEDPTCEAADIDGDGFVGGPDFGYLLVGLSATSADPAPSACGLGFELALVLPLLRWWRRRRLQAA